ncbi:scavenger receptor cysteine-rich domain-containing protein DMBT1-like [Ciconia maguari]
MVVYTLAFPRGLNNPMKPYLSKPQVIADELLLQLTGGPNRCAGNVEVFYFGGWAKVCGYLWDMQDAQVACRQLGCGSPLGVMHYFPSSGWYPYMMTEVNCAGSEDYLWYCPYKKEYSGCSHGDASVICSDSGLTVPPPTAQVIADELLLQLTGGPNRCAGNVEVFYFGGWAKVCGYLWDMQDAQVACRQLGCGSPLGVMHYFPSSGWYPYMMTEVNCAGSEDYLWYCPYKKEYSGCSHGDASVICSDSGLTVPPPAAQVIADDSGLTVPPPTAPGSSSLMPTMSSTSEETTSTAPPTTTETTTSPGSSSLMPTMSSTSENYSCGGLLSSPSGTLQSPFYPRNYPNNANCVWEIEVKSNFYVTLAFRDVQMEGGRCLSDYVEVYDGPLQTSPLLGKFCSGSFRTYTSSANLLTVRFYSNSRYTYRGFQAAYYSTPADQSTTLLCLPDYMHAVVSRYYLQSQGYSAWKLSLNDPYCKPSITSEYVIFDIPYTRCGTVREGNNNTIIYSNLIRGSSSGALITRNKNLHLHITCKMLQNTWEQIMYVAEDNFEVNETQYGRYDVNLTFYHSASFSRPVNDSPYYIDINQNLFLEAYLHSSDSNLVLFVDTCVASPTPHNFTTVTYYIIQNG